MAKLIKHKISIRIIVVMIIFISIGFFLCYLCINSLCNNYSKKIARSASSFVEVIIDADDAKNYLLTRKTDSNYEKTLKTINQFEEQEDTIRRISLISYSNSYGYYVYDSGGNTIGTKISYDSYTSSIKAELINGRNEWSHIDGNTMYLYHPLRTTDDKLAGYIIVEINNQFRLRYLTIIVIGFAGMFIIITILCLFLNAYMNKEIFVPIKKLSKTALDYTGSVSTSDNTDINELFVIKKDNEIGNLGKAIQKMMSDINNSTENLSKSIYEATHDGMTQIFNKRHYNNMTANFQNCSSICVIYFDVNNLKLMNDTLGHERGDYVIKQAATYICNLSTDSTFCFRMGGDEFLMIMVDCTFNDIDRIIEKLDTDSPIILSHESDSVKCALSYGFAYAKGFYSYDQLLLEAEENMYKKKAELKKELNMPDR